MVNLLKDGVFRPMGGQEQSGLYANSRSYSNPLAGLALIELMEAEQNASFAK